VLTVYTEPTATFTGGESGLTFTARTGTLDSGTANGETADVDGDTGTLTDTGATFQSDGGLGDRDISAGDMVIITDDNGAGTMIGVYKVVSVDSDTQLTLNTSDQIFSAYSGVTYIIKRPGMHLQYFQTLATQVSGVDITFADANPDTIARASGDFTSDGYTAGMAATVSGAVNAGNNGSFIIDSLVALTLTLIASETLTAEGPTSGVIIDGETGIVRTLNAVDYPFNWRLFGNNGSLSQCFQFIQKQLRRGVDIDEGGGTSRGDVTDLLMTFSTPTGVGLNMFIDDLLATNKNNASFVDLTGDTRTFAFLAGVEINLNDNILDSNTAKVVVFFTNDDAGDNAGRDFGTQDAIIVQKDDLTDAVWNDPSASPVSFSYDYDNNNQRGTGSEGQDAPVTLVAIGDDKAQYVKITGTIARQDTNVFSLSAALERNYSNP
jgi:hypothetical protein